LFDLAAHRANIITAVSTVHAPYVDNAHMQKRGCRDGSIWTTWDFL